MMDWNSDVWFYVIIIGIISFVLITLILLYIMRKGTSNLESTKSSDQQFEKTELKSNQNLDEIVFCPNCGVKFDEKGIEFCPACGHKIQ
ncbi:MAG: hypothetical protein ACW98D_01520 [Promethearchaeota archaeon]|jgi:hypothetical protein